MPEGDTLARTAAILRAALAGRDVLRARGRPGGARLDRVQGSRVERVEARGKHLLVGFSNGLALHTHLGVHGSWHRYGRGEAWRRGPARAVAVIEVDGHTAVCFDAPRAELIDARAEPLHPALAGLGPDLAAGPPDPATVLARMRAGERDESSVAEVLLDQAAVAGLGNAYRSEVLFVERVDPFAPVRDLPDEALVRLVATGSRLLRANLGGGPRSTLPGGLGRGLWVYGRASRPCRRCGSAIRSVLTGARPRRLYWCPSCQAPRAGQ